MIRNIPNQTGLSFLLEYSARVPAAQANMQGFLCQILNSDLSHREFGKIGSLVSGFGSR